MSNYCIEKEYEFNPICDPDVTFHLKALNTTQRDECISERYIPEGTELIFNKTKIFKYGVTSIDDLSINGNPVKTVKDFLSNDFSVMYEEVVNKIVGNTTRKDSKN